MKRLLLLSALLLTACGVSDKPAPMRFDEVRRVFVEDSSGRKLAELSCRSSGVNVNQGEEHLFGLNGDTAHLIVSVPTCPSTFPAGIFEAIDPAVQPCTLVRKSLARTYTVSATPCPQP